MNSHLHSPITPASAASPRLHPSLCVVPICQHVWPNAIPMVCVYKTTHPVPFFCQDESSAPTLDELGISEVLGEGKEDPPSTPATSRQGTSGYVLGVCVCGRGGGGGGGHLPPLKMFCPPLEISNPDPHKLRTAAHNSIAPPVIFSEINPGV